MVVTQYDSENWLDFRHKQDPGNVKDVCLVWGDNIVNGSYKKVSFSSGEFHCYWQWFGQNPSFSDQLVSNNHLLPSNSEIYQKLKSVNIGDQVEIKGYLVNYQAYNSAGVELFYRNTSTTRLDTGDGACEIIYVTGVTIIKRANTLLHIVNQGLGYIVLILILAFIVQLFKPFSLNKSPTS